MVPDHSRYVFATVGATMKDVVLAPDCTKIWLAAPPAMLVAVAALPLSEAVMVPAEKFPDASRATTLEAVFAEVASTAKVRAAAPVKVPALVKYVPAVSAFAT